jgi:hypothetical protein
MRSYHVIAVAVFLTVGFASMVLLFSIPSVKAQLNPITNNHPNITGLPLQDMGGLPE